jgi:hypothetical protein
MSQPSQSAPVVTPLPDVVLNGVAIKQQRVNGVSILTGLPVVQIGPVFVKQSKSGSRT